MTVETLTLRLASPADRAALERWLEGFKPPPASLSGQLLLMFAAKADVEICVTSDTFRDVFTDLSRAIRRADATPAPLPWDGAALTLPIAPPELGAEIAAAAAQTGRSPDAWAAEVLEACFLPDTRADWRAWAAAGKPAPNPGWRGSERLARIAGEYDPDPTRGGRPDLIETMQWAMSLFNGVTDQAGAPYEGHLRRVAEHHAEMFPDAPELELHAAWLHDAFEDAGVTPEDLAARGYPKRVAQIVQAVTKRDGEPYGDWIARIAAAGDAGVMRVKLADLTDNTDPARLAKLPDATRARLKEKYGGAADVLRQALARAKG